MDGQMRHLIAGARNAVIDAYIAEAGIHGIAPGITVTAVVKDLTTMKWTCSEVL